MSLLNESIQYNRVAFGPGSLNVSNQYLNKGFVLQQTGRSDSALTYYLKSLTIRKGLYGEKNIYTYGVLLTIAGLFEEQKRLDSAAYYYQRCLISLVGSFHEMSIFKNPFPDPVDISVDLVDGLVFKARVLQTQARANENDQWLLHAALQTYKLADSVQAEYRNYLPFEDAQLSFLKTQSIPYGNAIDCAFQLFRKTGRSYYLQDVFNLMERSRAVLVQQALNKARAFSQAGLPIEFLTREKELFRMRAALMQRYSDQRTDSLGRELLNVNEEIHGLRTSLEKVNPAYTSIQYKNQPPDLYRLQRFLEEESAVMLEYFWAPTDLYILIARPDRIALQKIAIDKEWSRSLDKIIFSIRLQPENLGSKRDYRDYCKAAFQLYNILVRDAVAGEQKPTRLIISPDAKLSLLPFEALVDSRPDTAEVNYNLPYLLHSFTISYSHSSRFLLNESTGRNSGNKILALGFSGEAAGRGDVRGNGWSELPGTEQEIESIRQVMKEQHNAYYLGANASESVFKKKASGFNIIHLAVHGVGDTVNALKSRLIFRNDTDTLEDGSLYAYEIYDMNLEKSRLAVLSACESGIGKQQAGEGLMSIARGFTYAGCLSQVISLWKVEDKVSAQIMADFYRHLSSGEPVDGSLRMAKLDYLKGAREIKSYPSYWAAFLPVGQVGPESRSFIDNYAWYTAAVLMTILLLRFLYNRLKL